jgi:predicted nucleotidyltransferase
MSAQLQGMLEDRIRRGLPHLKEEDVRALTPIVERLIEAYQLERIYLFGSKARGGHGPDSDFDLLVVVPNDAPADQKRSRLAYERLWGTGTAADVLVWTRGRFESRAHLRASLPGTISREGRLLYTTRARAYG